MSKKTLLIAIGAFTLIVNVALAIYFTLPTKEPEQKATHIVKGSYDRSVQETSRKFVTEDELEKLAEQKKAEEQREQMLKELQAETKTDNTSSADTVKEENPLVASNEAKEAEKNIPQETVTPPETKDSDSSKDVTATEKDKSSEPVKEADATIKEEAQKVVTETEEKTKEIVESTKEVVEEEKKADDVKTEQKIEETKKEEIEIKEEPKEEIKEEKAKEEAPKLPKKIVDEITMGFANNTFTIRVVANQPIKGRTLYVGNPERAILDLEGIWTLPNMPLFPKNPYSTNVRVGLQPDKTRFVVDITTKKFTRRLVQLDDRTIELRITF